MIDPQITDELAGDFMRLAISGINREFPNKPQNLHRSPADALTPRQLHPVFFGCFDWHSAVHAHWTLVRLAKRFPHHHLAPEVHVILATQLTAEKLQLETDYFTPRENHGFERMYGWAWLLRLAGELREGNVPPFRDLANNLQPLTNRLVELASDYLRRLTHPIRTGIHPDTAFALGQFLDYARTVGNSEFESIVIEAAKRFYLGDVDYPFRYEPSGEDFFSSGLNSADLMRRVLSQVEFSGWLLKFWPGLATEPSLAPVAVDHPDDGRLGHLAGLNLSRAWTLRGIALSLPADDPRRSNLLAMSTAHAAELRAAVFNGHYEGEHWLGTFAVYFLTNVGIEEG